MTVDWRTRLSVNSEGRIIANLPNLSLILVHDPDTLGVYGYDTFADRPMVLRPPPYRGLDPTTFPRLLTDSDRRGIRSWLQERYALQNNAPYDDAIIRACELSAYNPVTDYLSGLVWDRTPRIASIYTDLLGGTVNTGIEPVLIRKWLIAAVARALSPGCQADNVLILVGSEGLGKTSFFRIIASPWSLETSIDIDTRDQLMVLQSGWIVELSEFSSVRGARSIDRVKAFFTRTTDVYRRPWGRVIAEQPRHCVFAGTLNLTEFLTLEDGNRRYWPISIGELNRDAAAEQRDQIWAEAVNAYASGEHWWLEKDIDLKALQKVHRKHLEQDPWEPLIEEYVAGRQDGVSIRDILQFALQLPVKDWDIRHRRRVGAILRSLGYWNQSRNQIWRKLVER